MRAIPRRGDAKWATDASGSPPALRRGPLLAVSWSARAVAWSALAVTLSAPMLPWSGPAVCHGNAGASGRALRASR
jgi:hypothetical protein